jgi:hypothetical protein
MAGFIEINGYRNPHTSSHLTDARPHWTLAVQALDECEDSSLFLFLKRVRIYGLPVSNLDTMNAVKYANKPGAGQFA